MFLFRSFNADYDVKLLVRTDILRRASLFLSRLCQVSLSRNAGGRRRDEDMILPVGSDYISPDLGSVFNQDLKL